MTVFILKDKISADLTLRTMALDIFNSDEFHKDVVIDFAGVKSMSRAFAQEFLTHKQKLGYKVVAINLPMDIKKMFEVVENPKTKSELIKDSVPREIDII